MAEEQASTTKYSSIVKDGQAVNIDQLQKILETKAETSEVSVLDLKKASVEELDKAVKWFETVHEQLKHVTTFLVEIYRKNVQ